MKPRKNKNAGMVYSTDRGKMCPTCGKPIAQCGCGAKKSVPQGDGIVRIGRSTKGRKGKGVTMITGVPLESDALQELAKRLKQKCGSGGTIKEGVIEIQGDHRDLLVEELTSQGYTVKRSGG
jgi:translation initiation factor 1